MACIVFESGVIDAPAIDVWEKIRPFNFDFWKKVKKVEVEEKDAEHGEVGGIHNIYYDDDTMDKVKLLEMSDRNFFLSYAVLETTSDTFHPEIQISHSLRLRKVTCTDQSILEFTTNYSDEISLTNFIKSKNTKKDFFQFIRRVCTDPNDVGIRPWHCHECGFQNKPRSRNFKCNHCQRPHMFSKLLRIPCDLGEDQYQSERFWMCRNEWQIVLLPKGHVDHPGFIACYLKCTKLERKFPRKHTPGFKSHFIFTTLHPDEARLKKSDRKHEGIQHNDVWIARCGSDTGFWDQSTPEKCHELQDSNGKWGLLVQMIPGDRQDAHSIVNMTENFVIE